MKDLSKPRQDGQERWREPGWAAQTRGCLSGRLARSGTRCGRAAGWASGSSGKSQWQGCPPREQPVKQPFDLLQCWKQCKSLWRRFTETLHIYICENTHGSDETAICGSRKDLLFQSHVPAGKILRWILSCVQSHSGFMLLSLKISLPLDWW